jgi:hypothetical protein
LVLKCCVTDTNVTLYFSKNSKKVIVQLPKVLLNPWTYNALERIFFLTLSEQ